MPGRCQPDADRGGGKGGKGSGKGKTPLPLPPRILAGRGFVGCFSQLARVARVNSSLCTRAHARMHEKNLHLPLPPLPDEVIGRKALLGVGFRGKGKSPAGLPSPLPPLPLPLPSRARDGSAGVEGKIKTLPGGKSHSPGTPPVAEAGLWSWHGVGNVSRRERDGGAVEWGHGCDRRGRVRWVPGSGTRERQPSRSSHWTKVEARARLFAACQREPKCQSGEHRSKQILREP